jgi:hypothetical protein
MEPRARGKSKTNLTHTVMLARRSVRARATAQPSRKRFSGT